MGGKMNTWKDVPHLFWNGRFRFKHKDQIIPNDSFVSLNLHDEGETPTDIEISKRYSNKEREYPQWININDCTLIARKIEDMSDEEQEIFNYNFSEQKVIDSENNTWFTGDYEPFLYLLSIGVYPFDQSHFETGDLEVRYENN
jgi:hypothetical protein